MIVEVTRGPLVESRHHVAACAANASGDVLFASGDIESPVFLRSSAKPFIAATAIAAGARDAFGLEMPEIAVMAASHMGEPFHVEAVRSILRKIGMSEEALQCGAHYPYNERASRAMIERGEQPSAIHNNCSGKHAGILALCRLLGSDANTYMELSNPAEQRILEFCARMSDDDPQAWPLGVDGCGIPVYATGLRKTAMAFARFATLAHIPERDAMALLVVRDAMVSYPQYVSGTGEFDTVLMQHANGGIASKLGAEGVHAVALMEPGVGFASKVEDGTGGRARPPVTMAAVRALLPDGERLATELDGFTHPVVYNRAGRAVGAIRVTANFAVE